MEILIFCIPVITCIVLAWKFSKVTTWWEYAVVIVPSLLLYYGLRQTCIASSSFDTEYLGDYVSCVKYYEPWDEQVWVTKTREVPDGVDEDGHTKYRTETYEELEYRYHSAEYRYVSANTGSEDWISKDMYDLIVHKLHADPKFTDLHRDYYEQDGDLYTTSFDGKPEHCYTLTFEHVYKNKIMSTDYSIFRLDKVTDDEAVKAGLYKYPKIRNYDQQVVLGDNAAIIKCDKIRYVNGYYGKKHQFRMYVLLFNHADPSIADMQRNYWQGGNKNEMVVCLGVSRNRVKWCRTFSWSDEPALEVASRDYFIDNPTLDLNKYADFVVSNLDKWHRKSFSDFDYLSVELTKGQLTFILIFIIICNVLISGWVIGNEFDNDMYSGDSRFRTTEMIGTMRIYIQNKYNDFKQWIHNQLSLVKKILLK